MGCTAHPRSTRRPDRPSRSSTIPPTPHCSVTDANVARRAMTWCKFGTEFFDDLANAGLSDAAVRTHAEAISWIYRVEQTDLRIPKHLVRRFAGSEAWEVAVKDLVAAEFWRDD